MRLINTRTLEMEEFSLTSVPRYAILSHTWGEGEVSFQEMQSSEQRRHKKGFAKIVRTCRLAAADRLDHAWVDTCCIDKTSSAELTESINSMFAWYEGAAKCYVYLDDLDPHAVDTMFPHSRWFTRGWTLQELLAPRSLEFYDMAWNGVGTKQQWAAVISAATRIPPDVVLHPEDALARCSVAAKMSWAARRETARLEDTAYCLLGLFDVNMPLIYGEGGQKAFRRLQEEIIKRRNDMTILAWSAADDASGRDPASESSLGVLAESPAAFANSFDVAPLASNFDEFSVTNKGLLISGDGLSLRVVAGPDEGGQQKGNSRSGERYVLLLGSTDRGGDVQEGGIYLRKVGPGIYYRDGRFALAGFGRSRFLERARLDTTDYYVLIDPIVSTNISRATFRDRAIHVPPVVTSAAEDSGSPPGPRWKWTFRLCDTMPEMLWDHTDRVFLKPKPHPSAQPRVVLAMVFQAHLSTTTAHSTATTATAAAAETFKFALLADYRGTTPTCKMLEIGESLGTPTGIDNRRYYYMVLGEKHRRESILWSELLVEARPQTQRLVGSLTVKAGGGAHAYRIHPSFRRGPVAAIAKSSDLFSVEFHVERIGRIGF